jgi:hypothetical protein
MVLGIDQQEIDDKFYHYIPFNLKNFVRSTPLFIKSLLLNIPGHWKKKVQL